jgi:hypothetical protein
MFAVGKAQRRKAFQPGCGNTAKAAQEKARQTRRHGSRFARPPRADALAEIITPGFVGHLVNGRVIKGGGKIGVVPLFVGQFDNAQQTVAQAAVFFCTRLARARRSRRCQIHRRAQTAAAATAAANPPRGTTSFAPTPAYPRTDPRQKAPETTPSAAGHAANGDRGFDAPETAFDLGELLAESIRQSHGKFVIVFGHAILRLPYFASTTARSPKKKR